MAAPYASVGSNVYGSIVDKHYVPDTYTKVHHSSRTVLVPQEVKRTVYTNQPETVTVKEAYTSFRPKEVQTFETQTVTDTKTISIPRQAVEEVQHTVYDLQTIKVPRTVVTHRPVYETITKQVQVPSVGYVDKVVMVPKMVMVPHTVRVPVRTFETKDVQVRVPKIEHETREVQVPRTVQVPKTITVQEPVVEYRDKQVTVNRAVPQTVSQTVMRKAKVPVEQVVTYQRHVETVPVRAAVVVPAKYKTKVYTTKHIGASTELGHATVYGSKVYGSKSYGGGYSSYGYGSIVGAAPVAATHAEEHVNGTEV